MANKVIKNFTLDKGLADQLAAASEVRGESQSFLVREALRLHLRQVKAAQ